MLKKSSEFKRKRRQRFLLVTTLIALLLFFIAAMVRIGVGEAEWAGMTVSNLTANLAMEFNISRDEKGVVINWVEGSAYYSGVKEGDLLKAVNNTKVTNIKEFLTVARSIDLNEGALLDVVRDSHPLFITLYNKPGLHEKIKQALSIDATTPQSQSLSPAMTNVAFRPSQGAVNETNLPRDFLPVVVMTGSRLPTPKEQRASKKILAEGHWVGMELIPLIPELAKEYAIAPNTEGLLVDEISLEAAEAGVLAGDVVISINGVSTPSLIAFTKATRRVKNRKSAEILVSRRGQLVKLTISSEGPLGFSQNESAQPIPPGAISPHKNRGKPCTACHLIMSAGGQLPTDAGDILPNPPPITKDAVAPHEYRGKCKTCHVILRQR